MSLSSISPNQNEPSTYDRAYADQLVERTWNIFKSLIIWLLCFVLCLAYMEGTISTYPLLVFAQAAIVVWLLYQKRWFILARYYVFLSVFIGYMFFLARFGTDMYAYFGLLPLVLAITASFRSTVQKFGFSFLLIALTVCVLFFEVEIGFIDSVPFPERFRLLFMLICMGICYDIVGSYLKINREFRLRTKSLINQLEEKEASSKESCRLDEINVRQFELVNRKLETEIRKRVKVERELSSSNEQLSQFAYAASHDLKEPLRSISSFIQLIRRKVKGTEDPVLEDHAHAIIAASSKMTILLDDLLEYSRCSDPQVETSKVDLNRVVSSILYSMEKEISDNQISISVDELGVLTCNRMKIETLFRKIICNAIQNRSEDRRLELSISRRTTTTGDVEFLFKDNGRGIPDHEQDKVFNLFYKVGTSEKSKGTGVGLSTCRKIVSCMKGTINFRSNEDQHGVTCVLTFSSSIIFEK